jgi:hypothetical protein
MLSWTIQITIMSIILIFLVHHLINFFKSTLTVPKIKDLVNTPIQKYENMFNVISNKKNINTLSDTKDYTIMDLLPKSDDISMKNELKNFLKKQLTNTINNSYTEISAIDSMLGVNSYSNYK